MKKKQALIQTNLLLCIWFFFSLSYLLFLKLKREPSLNNTHSLLIVLHSVIKKKKGSFQEHKQGGGGSSLKGAIC